MQEYLIDGHWYAVPGDHPLLKDVPTRKVEQPPSRPIIQVVRPPRHLEHETSLRIRKAWDDNVYFPAVWNARPGIYRNPYVLVIGPNITIKARYNKSPHPSVARYVAVIETPEHELMLKFFNQPPRIDQYTIGVFERCESP